MRTTSTEESATLPVAMASAGMAGLIATWPMTRFMNWADSERVEAPHSSLPPREITEEVTSAMVPLSESETQWATLAAHYGYGAAVGSLLPVVAPRCAGNPLSSGVVFGLGVWFGSYYGLLPAMGSQASAPCQTHRVHASMFAAHLVWGAVLGMLTATFLRASTRLRSGREDRRSSK